MCALGKVDSSQLDSSSEIIKILQKLMELWRLKTIWGNKLKAGGR